MASELIYTSAPRGVRPGTSGFCTVAYTRGMSASTVRLLESLSAYKHLYAAHDPRAARNPVVYSHYRYTISGRSLHILSRISAAAADHTNRSNTIAHHLVVSPTERPDGGPAWLALQPGVFVESWDREPERLEGPKPLPRGDAGSTVARTWHAAAGDAGWAGVLAYAFLRRPSDPAFLLFEPGQPMLELIAEALALLPPRRRWDVTFSTYFTLLPAGTTCAWRCCVPGSEAAREVRRFPRSLVIDLTQPPGAPPDNPLVQEARQGAAAAQVRRPDGRRPPPPPASTRFKLLESNRRRTIRLKPGKPGGRQP
ncbi:MAG: hypothetical protein GXP31_03290 [Kiritimatiellaeota bacterium]|nr:hypothetical protein [Kiritimatiellota bacterium]